MKINWEAIKFIALAGVVVLLFSFTKKRNQTRTLTGINVEFIDENDPFITLNSVNKLLIVNQDSVTSIPKETLALKDMESRLLANDMIRDAQVFVTVDGVLGAKIEQRNPIARVVSSPDFYIDEDGTKMPLSSVYTSRVPIVRGAGIEHFNEIASILKTIKEDDFLNKAIVGIDVLQDNTFRLSVRQQAYKVNLGKAENLLLKFQNYKAFYQKAKKDSLLKKYAMVDLQFGHQVVATKK